MSKLLDLERLSKSRFLWDRAQIQSKNEGAQKLRIQQTNMVLRWNVVNRATNELSTISYDGVDYDRYTYIHTASRFKSQRQIKCMWPSATAVLVYFTGRSVSVGSSDMLYAILGIYHACRTLFVFRRDIGMQFVVGGITWINAVYHGRLPVECNLVKLVANSVSDSSMNVTYDGDHFTGAAFECTDDRIPGTLVIYSTGKFVCVGVNGPDKLEHGFSRVYDIFMDMAEMHLPIGTHLTVQQKKKKRAQRRTACTDPTAEDL